jgi:hypothetical protein
MATSSAFGAWLDSVKVSLKAAVSNPAQDLAAIKAEKNPARQVKLCEDFLQTHAALKKECDLVQEFLVVAKKEHSVKEDLQAIKAEKDPAKQIKLCENYLKTHADMKNECDLVEEFLAAANKEWGVAQAKKAYLLQAQGKADDELNPENKFDLKHLTTKAKTAAQGDLTDKRGHGMDEAEVAAVKTFTAQDYKYLNPAVANQKDKDKEKYPTDWMDTYQEKPGLKTKEEIEAEWPAKKKELYEEGALHAGVMMEGLKKITAKGVKIYRGFGSARTSSRKNSASAIPSMPPKHSKVRQRMRTRLGSSAWAITIRLGTRRSPSFSRRNSSMGATLRNSPW